NTLSGRCEKGSSRAPESGKIGTDLGRSAGEAGRLSMMRSSTGSALPWRAAPCRSGKQGRRQQASALDGSGILDAPGVEEFQQLLARAISVPVAVALEDGDQRLGRLDALAFGIERQRQVVAGLVVVGIGG